IRESIMNIAPELASKKMSLGQMEIAAIRTAQQKLKGREMGAVLTGDPIAANLQQLRQDIAFYNSQGGKLSAMMPEVNKNQRILAEQQKVLKDTYGFKETTSSGG